MQSQTSQYFRFKRFGLYHGHKTFKIGTDAVILGAYSGRNYEFKNILDIGTGSGILALMLAQRFENAAIKAVEINKGAAEMALKNFSDSPFDDRLGILRIDLKDYSPENQFDLIVSNPPYFTDSLKPLDETKNRSKHDDTLNLENIISFSYNYLAPMGELSLIVPIQVQDKLEKLSFNYDFNIKYRLLIKAKPDHDPHRLIIGLTRNAVNEAENNSLIIENDKRHDYHQDYINLCKEFYLKF